MIDILGMFEEDSAGSAAEAVSTDGLKSVAELARRIRETEAEIKRAEEFLKERNDVLRKMTDEDLPLRFGRAGRQILRPRRRQQGIGDRTIWRVDSCPAQGRSL
jgi:uncharacterized small protein (DUF1192 family)